LILSVPGESKRGIETDAIVELVDVYPTLSALCRLPAPQGMEGINLQPLLERPERPWKLAAFSQYPRALEENRHHGHGEIMGYAIRTHRYRYVEWRFWQSQRVTARELYDHQNDPHETQNLASQAGHQNTLNPLSRLLADGWQAALPVATEPGL
nr:DUF4976 domain-containing protein [Methylococcales bacterium]